MKYSLSSTARGDLAGIRDYLAPVPKHIQLRIMGELKDGFRQAAEYPFSGRHEADFSNNIAGIVRSILVHPYRVFYRAETNPLIIVAILHGAQDIATILHGRATPPNRPE